MPLPGPTSLMAPAGSRRGRLVLTLVLAGLTIPMYFVVERVSSAQPGGRPFPGWVNVLEDANEGLHSIGLVLQPVSPGGAGSHPLVQVDVLVCGTEPFHGVLLLGGAARLGDPKVLKPDPFRGAMTSASVSPRAVVGPLLDLARGMNVPITGAQAFAISFDQLAPCVAPPADTASAQPLAIAGTPFSLVGQLGAPVLRRDSIWHLQSPRQDQVWPISGAFSEQLQNDLGEFEGPPSLPGRWIRPPSMRIEVRVGSLNPGAEVEFTRPQSVATGESLDWTSSVPMAPVAQLLDTQSVTRWQDILAVATILLAVGASIVGTILLQSARVGATDGPATIPGPVRRNHTSSPEPHPGKDIASQTTHQTAVGEATPKADAPPSAPSATAVLERPTTAKRLRVPAAAALLIGIILWRRRTRGSRPLDEVSSPTAKVNRGRRRI
jgi:hypothetical protein